MQSKSKNSINRRKEKKQWVKYYKNNYIPFLNKLIIRDGSINDENIVVIKKWLKTDRKMVIDKNYMAERLNVIPSYVSSIH